MVDFRTRLLGTLRAARPLLEVQGVLVVGSEVPNLIEPGAASTLVVSQDVDLGVPLEILAGVKARLREVSGFHRSPEAPAVLLPENPDLLEINLLGLDRSLRDPARAYIHEDPDLPLIVFGALGLVEPGPVIWMEELRVPLPRLSTLLAEKLLTERSGEKGDRDLLVALGLLTQAAAQDLQDAQSLIRTLPAEARHAARSNLTILSLLEPREGMPDPRPHREAVLDFLKSLEGEQP